MKNVDRRNEFWVKERKRVKLRKREREWEKKNRERKREREGERDRKKQREIRSPEVLFKLVPICKMALNGSGNSGSFTSSSNPSSKALSSTGNPSGGNSFSCPKGSLRLSPLFFIWRNFSTPPLHFRSLFPTLPLFHPSSLHQPTLLPPNNLIFLPNFHLYPVFPWNRNQLSSPWNQ